MICQDHCHSLPDFLLFPMVVPSNSPPLSHGGLFKSKCPPMYSCWKQHSTAHPWKSEFLHSVEKAFHDVAPVSLSSFSWSSSFTLSPPVQCSQLLKLLAAFILNLKISPIILTLLTHSHHRFLWHRCAHTHTFHSRFVVPIMCTHSTLLQYLEKQPQ